MSTVGKVHDAEILGQGAFLRMLGLERKRSERSHRSFVLMLVRTAHLGDRETSGRPAEQILQALCTATRETDIKGWYDSQPTIGVIFTEVGDASGQSITDVLANKMKRVLHGLIRDEDMAAALSFHIYPEEAHHQNPDQLVDPIFYSDLEQSPATNRVETVVKRLIDIVGSLFGLILCSPILLTIALLIKLTSKGPILFRQQRIGHYGKAFTFLKFRSMFLHSDNTIHKTFVTAFISAKSKPGATEAGASVTYKLTKDPRITKVGRFLRRTSLDELPQLLNVLKGDMSLVGPRPAILYEFYAYKPWHKNRLVVVKPGITGLWQVAGRSRVTFDEMVRLDLRYATAWSLRLDFEILLRTPKAVFSCQGAH